MNHKNQSPYTGPNMDHLKRAPFIPGRYSSPQGINDNDIETIVIEGSKYRLYVLTDKKADLPNGYRLRHRPIDPAIDYTNMKEDFDVMNAEQYGKSAFDAAYEKFIAGNEEFDKIIENAKRTMY